MIGKTLWRRRTSSVSSARIEPLEPRRLLAAAIDSPAQFLGDVSAGYHRQIVQNVPARRTDSWGFDITQPVAITLLADRLKHDGDLILQQTNSKGRVRTVARSSNPGRSAERIELTLEPGRYNIILSNQANKTNSYRLTARTAVVAAPSRVEATVWSGTSAHVRWLDNSHNETGFRVQQWIRGRWKNVAEANRNATAAVVSGHLQPGHEPIFRVVARRGQAAIASTNTMSVTMTGSDESGWYRVTGISGLTKGEAGFIKKNASLTIHPDFVDPNDSSRSKWVHAANWQEAVRSSLKADASFEVTFDRGSLKKGDTVVHNNIASQGSFEINTARNVRARGLNSTRGASEIPIPPIDPDARLVAIEDSYQAGYQVDNDYDDWWWEVEVERATLLDIEHIADGSEEPAVPYDDEHTPARVVFQVTRDGPLSESLSVPVSVIGGTATPGGDFVTPDSIVHFPAGDRTARFSIKPIWDYDEEGAETILVQIATPPGAFLLNQAVAEGRIDDEFVPAIRAKVAMEEGSSLSVYEDTKGNKTIGIGHNMGPVGTDIGVADFERVTGASFHDVKAGLANITEAQQDALFKFDLDKHLAQVRKEIPNFDQLPLRAKIVLTDMTFNMGSLTKYKDLKEAIGRRDYRQAAWDIGHKTRDPNSPESDYARQVPARAARNIAMMEQVATEAGQ